MGHFVFQEEVYLWSRMLSASICNVSVTRSKSKKLKTTLKKNAINCRGSKYQLPRKELLTFFSLRLLRPRSISISYCKTCQIIDWWTGELVNSPNRTEFSTPMQSLCRNTMEPQYLHQPCWSRALLFLVRSFGNL